MDRWLSTSQISLWPCPPVLTHPCPLNMQVICPPEKALAGTRATWPVVNVISIYDSLQECLWQSYTNTTANSG